MLKSENRGDVNDTVEHVLNWAILRRHAVGGSSVQWKPSKPGYCVTARGSKKWKDRLSGNNWGASGMHAAPLLCYCRPSCLLVVLLFEFGCPHGFAKSALPGTTRS